MKNKKVIFSIFLLILLCIAIPFLNINYNTASDNQKNSTEDHKVKNTATKTAILRPNGDILTEWDGSPTPHWSRINEVSPNYLYARWIDGDENQTEIYDMDNLDIPNINATKLYSISISSIRLSVYGYRYYTGPAVARLYLGGWTTELQLNLPTNINHDWIHCTWNNLDGTYVELEDLKVNVTAGTWCSTGGYGEIDTLYCRITYSISELPVNTATLRPNEDISIEWDGSPTPHWSRIDESSPDGVYARWIDGDENQSDIFGMQELYFENAIVTTIELYAYGLRYYTGPAFASIYLGEWTPQIELNLGTSGPGWRTCIWDGLDGTYEELKNLQVNLTAGVWCSADGYGRIDTLYCIITIEEPIFQIITPENKTYTEPMTGYYPATYGFENDVNGDDPEGWTIEQELAGNIEIVSEISGHNKVLKIPDNNSQSSIIYQSFENYHVAGTVEFWVLVENANERITITIGDDNAGNPWEHGCNIWFARDGKIQLYNGSNFIDAYSGLQSNIWYHLKIEFDCNDDNWHLWLNGAELDVGGYALRGSPISMTKLRLGSQSNPEPVAYFDAIGYSWDPNYNIGDNTREGILLSYQSNINLNWIGYSLDGQEDITIYGNTTILPKDGSHNIQLFGNDSRGNGYFSEIIYFYLDILEPLITIISPNQNEFFGSGAPNFEITIEEVTLNTTWYTLDGGITNITFSGLTGTIDQTEWDGLGEGVVNLMFFANDSIGRIGKAEVTIHKDTSIPQVIIVSPNLNDIFNSEAPNFEIIINELYLESTWYSMDGGITNITFIGLTGTIDQTEWDSLADGVVTLMFYAKDYIGRIGKAGVVIHKDALIPQVTIISPNLNAFYGINAPDFEISIEEVYLISTWYTLDGGITNITFTGLTGTIDQTEWDGLSEGMITIRIFANDSMGHEGYSEISFYKDITPPTSLISYTPYKQPNVVLKSTKFTITADDGSASGISIIRYKINDSSWMEYSSSFDLSIYTLGYYQISYQAIDNVGNVETENFILVKLEEIPTQADSLPIIITVSAVSGGAIIAAVVIYSFIRKKRKR